MSLQESTLKLYKETFPEDKLKDISDRTNIQMTRVFRILNGSDMKLKEYEIFQAVLNKNEDSQEIIKISKQCLNELSKNRRTQLISYMKQALKIAQFNQYKLNTQINQDCIA